ncbi:hypothetical protein [uncultured Deinococcus sp.]|uniref:hypothetical protein n=1 Tax=uncultured Deinococcus sp. TaxID=158789 RepID=UPI0025F85696|nr:hypothetical protein [uncultured Deinococcus sp.]
MNEMRSPTPRPDHSTTGRVPRSTLVATALLLGAGSLLLGRFAPEATAAVAGRAWAAVLILPLIVAVLHAVQVWRTAGRVPRNLAVWVVIAAVMAVTGLERLTGLGVEVWGLLLGVLAAGVLMARRRR